MPQQNTPELTQDSHYPDRCGMMDVSTSGHQVGSA